MMNYKLFTCERNSQVLHRQAALFKSCGSYDVTLDFMINNTKVNSTFPRIKDKPIRIRIAIKGSH